MRDGIKPNGEDQLRQDAKSKSWKAIFEFTKRGHVLAFIPAIAFSIAGGALGPVMAIFLGRFLDAFADFESGKITPDKLMERTLKSVYALFGLGVGNILLEGGLFVAWLSFGEMQAKSVRDDLFQALLQKDLEWFEMRESGVGALLARLQTQIRTLQLGTSQPMGFALQLLIEGFVALGLSFSYGWKLTLVILASIPVSAVILHFISRGLHTNIMKHSDALSAAAKISMHAISNISLLKYFNTQTQESHGYISQIRIAATFALKQARATALQQGFIKFASTTMFVQGFWYGSVLVHKGEMTAGKVITVFWSALMAVQSFQGILPHVLTLAKAQAAAIILKTVIETVNRGKRFTRTSGLLSPDFCYGDIEVRDVSFAYPARPDHLVLHPSTFFFPAGETTFIVGKSGSGKSTVGSLLVRFYRPSAGRVVIDGHDLENLSTSWLRNNISLVQQQSVLFNETIFKNIAFGHQYHEAVNHTQVKAGLDVAALQDTVSNLPRGLDTKVGAGGSALSGGQKQRIAIARARLRDTPVLILDESTSALDYVSRTSVMSALRDWRQNRTTIVITHDMTQIQDSDFVYVLRDGNIIAEGFRQNVEKVLQDEFFDPVVGAEQTSHPKPPDADSKNTTRSIEMQNADPRPTAVKRRTHHHQRRDSLEEQVNETAIGAKIQADPSIRRVERLSRYVGNPLLSIADPVPELPPPVPAVPSNSIPYIHSRTIDKDESWAKELKQQITDVGVRPLSMHQSFALRNVPYNRETGKPLASPKVMDKPRALRRISMRRTSGFVKLKEPTEQPQMSIKTILSTVWPILGFKGRLELVLGFVATAVCAAVPPVFAFILVKLFQTFYLPTGYKHKALIFSLSMLGLAGVDGVASFSSKLLLDYAAQQWIDTIRVEAMMRIVEQPRAWFDDTTNSPAYLTSALDRNAEEMRNLVTRFVAMMLVIVIMMTVSTIWALIRCWKLTLVAFSTAPAVYGLTKAFNIISSRWEGRTNSANDEIGAIFDETFSDIRTVRTLTLESHFHRKYHLATSSAFSTGLQRASYSGLLFGLSASAINFIVALVFFYGARLAKDREFPVGDILHAFSLIAFSTAAANGIISYMPQLASSVDTGSRLLQLSRLPLDSHEFSGDVKSDLFSPTALLGPIEFRNLTFYYPTRPQTPALDRLNFTIPPRICTAIVGSSGSGKSTIASLLLKLYPTTPSHQTLHPPHPLPSPSPPPLTIATHDIQTLHTTTLRGLIAIVPQTPTLLPHSVRENICYGLSPHSRLRATDKVQAAAKQAGVHDFILSLPLQYETVIGEGGLGVSGGQAQRIVIARALVRRPQILILDEPTSALDGESAGIVRESIRGLVGGEGKLSLSLKDTGSQSSKVVGSESLSSKGAGSEESKGPESHTPKTSNAKVARAGMTVIIITHAKEMMQFADHVIVLDEGRMAEQGTYESLLRRKGKLCEMLRAGGVVE